MARSTSRRLALAFIVLLTAQEFRPLHSIQKLPLRVQNKMLFNFSSISQKTPDDQSGLPHLHIDLNDNFENETEHHSGCMASTAENLAPTDVNIALPASISRFASNKLNTASIMEINSSQDLHDEPGLTGKRQVRDDLAPSFQNHSSSGQNFSKRILRPNSYPGKERPNNTGHADRSFNSSFWNDLKIWQKYGSLNVTSGDGGEVNGELTKTHRGGTESVDFQLVEQTGDSRPFNMTQSVMDKENEESLVYTCADKCGEERLFPCSCSALCVVYDTCCENFSQDCPHILQDARYTFGDLITSDKFCGVDSVFIISSCPRQLETHDMEPNELRPNTTVMAEEILREATQNVSFFRVGEFGSLTTSLAPEGPEETVEERLRTAALRAPVTDASSGITYINKTVFDCHKHRDNNFFVWALQLDYVYINPKSLEDLSGLEDLDQYEPLFNRAILSRHLCLGEIIRTCPATWHAPKGEENYDKKCSEFFALTVMKGTFKGCLYRNRFCAYCNEGQNNTYVLRDQIGTIQRENELRMLMTINHAGHFTIKVRYPSFFNPSLISWSKVSCEPASSFSRDELQGNLTSITPGQKSVCSVKCSRSGHTLRADGYCKTLQAAKVAVSDDGLPPLCSEALQGLASFISCGLQSMIHSMPHAEFLRPTASIQIDSKTQKILYVVRIELDLVFQYGAFFSTTEEESMLNWRHLEVLAKSLKHYRLSNDLCGVIDSDTNNLRSDKKQVTSFSFENLVASSRSVTKLFQQLEESVGPVIDTTNTTTFCMSPVSPPNYYEESILVCRETFVYAPDAKAIAEFMNSPCFSHLDNLELANSRGSKNIIKDRGRNLQTHWLLAVGVGVLIVKTRNVY